MRLIFIPRPAPTGARNRGYRFWFLLEPESYPGGMGYPLEACRTFSTRSAPLILFGTGGAFVFGVNYIQLQVLLLFKQQPGTGGPLEEMML